MRTKNGKNIDNDVVEQILSMLLNPKTLMRFKCVSKMWYAMITNPRFVAKHLSNSLNNKNSTTSILVKHLAQKDTNVDSEAWEKVFSLLNFCNDIVNDIVNIHMPLCDGGLNAFRIIGHCNGIICLTHSISGEVILCNPAIQESKLLTPPPYLQESKVYNLLREFVDALGFGYDVILNEYKVINIGFPKPYYSDTLNIFNPPKVAVHTLGTDCWREMESGCLETETSVLWPELFQVYVKQMCYWLGREQHKELDILCVMEEEFFRDIIIMFDTGHELFHCIMLPNFYDEDYYYLFYSFQLLEWNESVVLFGYKSSEWRFGMWVMDEEFDVIKGVEGAWTKYINFEAYESPLAFWKSNEILMTSGHNSMLSYNFASKKRKYLPIEDLPLQNISYDYKAIVYVNSIVTVLRTNSVKRSRENSSINELDFDIFNHPSLLNHHLMVKKKSHSYSIWVIPPDDVSVRIKKVMEGLRAEFGGPEIEPHITIVGSIHMNHEDVLNKFLSLRSLSWIFANQPKVNIVVTRNFYYQCVSLELSSELDERCSPQFGIILVDPTPHLSLLYGYLAEEERNKAKEIVNILDESLCTLTFPVTRLALYKIDYNDTSLKSWEKIAEFLHHGRPSP